MPLRSLLTAVALLPLLIWPQPAAAIDCTRAATPVERGICADPLLLALEAELNKAYWDEGLARDQRRWLRRRDRTCADRPVAACLAPLYRERIEVLRLTSYMDPTVVDWAVVLHGRWRVQPLTEPFPADAEVPIPFWDGATVWQTEEGLCMRGDNDAPDAEYCYRAISGRPLSYTVEGRAAIAEALEAHGFGRPAFWVWRLQITLSSFGPLVLLEDGTLLGWSDEVRRFLIWRPLDGEGGYTLVRTEGPVTGGPVN